MFSDHSLQRIIITHDYHYQTDQAETGNSHQTAKNSWTPNPESHHNRALVEKLLFGRFSVWHVVFGLCLALLIIYLLCCCTLSFYCDGDGRSGDRDGNESFKNEIKSVSKKKRTKKFTGAAETSRKSKWSMLKKFGKSGFSAKKCKTSSKSSKKSKAATANIKTKTNKKKSKKCIHKN